jgi:hypothetical protein
MTIEADGGDAFTFVIVLMALVSRFQLLGFRIHMASVRLLEGVSAVSEIDLELLGVFFFSILAVD